MYGGHFKQQNCNVTHQITHYVLNTPHFYWPLVYKISNKRPLQTQQQTNNQHEREYFATCGTLAARGHHCYRFIAVCFANWSWSHAMEMDLLSLRSKCLIADVAAS